jgi:glycosyltransferase involved in cell wall biosynthesis
MKTIAHYTDTVAFGGAEKMLLTLVDGLNRTGWRSLLYYHPHPGVESLEKEARVRGIETVPLLEARDFATSVRIPTVARALRKASPDIFHAHLTWGLRCSGGLVAARAAGIRHRVATQQLFVREPKRRHRYKQLAVSALVDRYIAVSSAMASELKRAVLNPHKVRVVYNGVEIERFDHVRETAVHARDYRQKRPLVLSLARLHWQKGLVHLIAAAARVTDAEFMVAGEGEERARLEAEVARWGLTDRFHLLGHREDIPDLLQRCDLVVLPSLFEGLPVSILEAMAARKPVVASAIAGTAEAVVDGHTGLLVPPGDSNALMAAIRRVLDEPCLAQRLGAAGRARVEAQFSAESMVEGVAKLYQELLDS